MKRVFSTVAKALAAAVGAAALWPVRMPEGRITDWPRHAVEPAASLRVLWVGHSLMNHRDPHAKPPRNLLETVGKFADARGKRYEALDHTLFGSPLALLWRGSPHTFSRSEPAMAARRKEFISQAKDIDAVVMTELLPVRDSLQGEHSAYYAQAFYCGVARQNPRARVYLYETWSHLFGANPQGRYGPVSSFDWSKRLAEDRVSVERIADLAATGQVPAPGMFARLQTLANSSSHCTPGEPIFIIPVGSVFRALAQVLKEETLRFADRRLVVGDLFANPYTSWPDGWPLRSPLSPQAEAAQLSQLQLRLPNEPFDDIHPSHLGIYVAALVHFATLFAASPLGLPNDIPGLPQDTAYRLADLVWQVVRNDPRTGVR